MIYYSIATYVFLSLSRSHIAREMLTYCHASTHSCSRLIPCEDRALTIRGFPALHRAERGVKVFGGADPLCPAGISPSMGRRAGAVLAVVTAPSHRGEGWGGVCKGTESRLDCLFIHTQNANPQTLAITGGVCGLCILRRKNAPWA